MHHRRRQRIVVAVDVSPEERGKEDGEHLEDVAVRGAALAGGVPEEESDSCGVVLRSEVVQGVRLCQHFEVAVQAEAEEKAGVLKAFVALLLFLRRLFVVSRVTMEMLGRSKSNVGEQDSHEMN